MRREVPLQLTFEANFSAVRYLPAELTKPTFHFSVCSVAITTALEPWDRLTAGAKIQLRFVRWTVNSTLYKSCSQANFPRVGSGNEVIIMPITYYVVNVMARAWHWQSTNFSSWENSSWVHAVGISESGRGIQGSSNHFPSRGKLKDDDFIMRAAADSIPWWAILMQCRRILIHATIVWEPQP